jgi:hypothetical protein
MAPPKPRDTSARAEFDKAAAVAATDGSSVELGDSTVVSTYFEAAGG